MMVRKIPKPKHKRRVPKRKNRGEFKRSLRRRVFEEMNGLCQNCGGLATEIHHVKPKGSGNGRGVRSNAMAVCQPCHRKIHDDYDLMRHWQGVYEAEYGADYFRDKWDLE